MGREGGIARILSSVDDFEEEKREKRDHVGLWEKVGREGRGEGDRVGRGAERVKEEIVGEWGRSHVEKEGEEIIGGEEEEVERVFLFGGGLGGGGAGGGFRGGRRRSGWERGGERVREEIVGKGIMWRKRGGGDCFFFLGGGVGRRWGEGGGRGRGTDRGGGERERERRGREREWGREGSSGLGGGRD